MIHVLGFLFILILGTLCHFIYEWSKRKKIFAIFCAVNESTWEHLKLVMGPFFLWMMIEIPFIGDNPNYLFAKAVSLIIMILFIPLFFYGYQALTKKDIFYLDILDFIIAILLGQYASYYMLNIEPVSQLINIISLITLIIILILYLSKTINPSRNFLFRDPITNKYGLDAYIPNRLKLKKKKTV